MTSSTASISPRLQARIAGFLYLIIMVCGYLAEGYVRGSLTVSGDPAATAQNILASEQFYRLGGAVEFLTLFCDMTVAVILYVLLRPVNQTLSLMAVMFRVVFVAVYAPLSIAHFAPLFFLKGGAPLAAFTQAQLQDLAYFSLRLHALGFNIANVFFGVHCMLIGSLIARSTFLPRLIGLMLAIAGACYVFDSFAALVAPSLRAMLFPWLLLPGFIAEGSLALWLFLVGLNAAKWNAAAGITGPDAARA